MFKTRRPDLHNVPPREHYETSRSLLRRAGCEVFTTRQPYAEKGTQDVTNDRDSIFAESNGQLTLSLSPDGDGSAATFAIGVQLG
jgi:hypothetical protein